MKSTIFSYRNGKEIINNCLMDDVVDTLDKINPTVKKNSVTFVKDEIKNGLSRYGWTENYLVNVETKITISFFNDQVGLCVQTGNISRIYADLLKLQALFIERRIKVGVIIVPQKSIAKIFGSNMANYERLKNELEHVFSQVITTPLVVVGFDEEK